MMAVFKAPSDMLSQLIITNPCQGERKRCNYQKTKTKKSSSHIAQLKSCSGNMTELSFQIFSLFKDLLVCVCKRSRGGYGKEGEGGRAAAGLFPTAVRAEPAEASTVEPHMDLPLE